MYVKINILCVLKKYNWIKILFFYSQRLFGISTRVKEDDDKLKHVLKDNEDLKEQNVKLTLELSKAKKEIGKVCIFISYLF